MSPSHSHLLPLAVLHVTQTTLTCLQFLIHGIPGQHHPLPTCLANTFSYFSLRFSVGITSSRKHCLIHLTLTFHPGLVWVLILCVSPPGHELHCIIMICFYVFLHPLDSELSGVGDHILLISLFPVSSEGPGAQQKLNKYLEQDNKHRWFSF